MTLSRYPHALLVCASAIEGCLQTAKIGSKDRDGLQALIKKAAISSSAIKDFSKDLLERLRETRNRFVHHGFSPHDDSESVSLYLDVALPFLSSCYREFHDFDFVDALHIEYSSQINSARKVHSLAKKKSISDLSYCLHGFSHLIRWNFKKSFSAEWEIDALTRAEENGGKFERTFAEKKELERQFEMSWSFVSGQPAA